MSSVSYVGALSSAGPNGGTQTFNLTLPSGCAAGDFAVVTGNMDGLISDGDGMSISGGVTLLPATSFGSDGETSCVIGKFLTSTDITNGYVTVTKTGPYTSSFTGFVARDVNTTTPLYAGSTWNPQNTPSTNPTATGTSISVPAGGLAIWACFLDISGSDNGFINTPSAWTLAKLAQESYATQAVCYDLFASAGSTGAVGAATASSDQVAWAVWMGALQPAGTSTDSAAVNSSLGALATVATTAASVAVAASCGMGGFSCSAGVSAVMAVQDASALGALNTTMAEHAFNTAAAAPALPPLVSSAGTSASQALSVTGAIGPLASAITVSAINTNTASVVSSLGALAASGTIALSQAAALASQSSIAASLSANAVQGIAASAAIGPLSSALTVNSVNVNTAAISATLGALTSRGTGTQSTAATASSALALATSAQTTASQDASVWASLPSLWTSIALSAQNIGQIHSTLGPLSSVITIEPPPAGYAADGHYYVAIPARWFYAALPARSFYILSDPNMTTAFSNLDPRETEVLTFDASNDLADGETLTNIESVAISVQSGPPTSTLPTLSGQIINGSPVTLTVNGKTITIPTGCCVQVVGSGGVTGTQYLIAITCTTSNPDKVLTLKGILPVSAQ